MEVALQRDGVAAVASVPREVEVIVLSSDSEGEEPVGAAQVIVGVWFVLPHKRKDEHV